MRPTARAALNLTAKLYGQIVRLSGRKRQKLENYQWGYTGIKKKFAKQSFK